MSDKIHVPEALGLLEQALDDLIGIPDSGKRISAQSKSDGALGKFAALATAISKAASGGGIRPGTTTPAWARPSDASRPPAAKEISVLDQYEALQGALGKSFEAGEFYSQHADEILGQLSARHRKENEERRRIRGY